MLQRLRLTPAPGHWLIADRLRGEGPGYVFLHGLASVRAGHKSDRLLAHARRRGRAFLRFDFRGHGESSGELSRISLTGLIEDARAALAEAGPSILFGSSLGGLVASWVAASTPAACTGLVLLAPAFGFLRRLEARREDGYVQIDSSWTPTRLHESAIADARGYDEAELPEKIGVPVLVVHGEHDDTVPVAESERFFARLPHERKKLWIVPGGDHRLHEPIEQVCALMDEMFG